MHQTFYIDIDEEITSVVERLRNAKASEIILVVPKRALLIQSIVNLRILKREADESRMQLMMVTQDKLGKILIEKAGIFVQQKMDNITDEEVELKEAPEDAEIPENPILEKYEAEDEKMILGKNRLAKIGSASYFDENQIEEDARAEKIRLGKENFSMRKADPGKEKLINKELVLAVKTEEDKKPLPRVLPSGASFDLMPIKPQIKAPADIVTMPSAKAQPQRPIALTPRPPEAKPPVERDVPISQDKKIEDFFYQLNSPKREERKIPTATREYGAYALPTKVHKWFWIFGAVAILAAGGAVAYLFVPKAKVDVTVKLETQAVDSQIIGKNAVATVGSQNSVILAKVVSAQQEVKGSYDATGNASVSNQKSHGTITIYNEYDTSEHSLVATTRFITPEGKLFRLIKGVTVPAMGRTDGQSVSGQVTAEVVADEAGDSYNVGPTTFSIPGFQSSGTKYQKIYAKSEASMTGGGAGEGELKAITESDMASAKGKILAELNGKLEDSLRASFGENAAILDGAMKEEEVNYNISNSAGDVANSFEITASVSAQAIVVNKKDLDKSIVEMIGEKAGGKSIEKDSIITNFSLAEADFANGIITIKFHSAGKISPEFNEDDIRKAILGKSEEEVKTYLSDFPDIQKMEVEYWPSFISGRIPFLASRVDVSLDRQ